MEFALYINTDRKQAYGSASGNDAPVIAPVSLTHLKLSLYFAATSADAALLDDTTSFRVALVDKKNVGNVLALLSAPTTVGTDHYEFEWSTLNRSNLLALLGNAPSAEAELVIVWTIGTVVERVVVPVTIANGYLQDDATAPDLTPFLTNLLANGYLEFKDADGNYYHLGLNTGRAPSP